MGFFDRILRSSATIGGHNPVWSKCENCEDPSQHFTQRLQEARRTVFGADSEETTPRYSGADKSLARPGRKQDRATEDFDFRVSYL